MDWTTVALTTLISAIVSGSIGLFFSSRTTVAQMRARDREEARQQIVVYAQDLQRRLHLHRDSGNPRGCRIGTRIELDDLSTAWPVLHAIQRMGWFRRWWTTKLALRIFGLWVVDRVRLMKGDSGESAFSAWVHESIRMGNAPVVTGSWHQALSAPSDSPELRRGIRDLRLLELL